jgi:predicted GNAT superfamily acetyltransferase
MSMTMNAWDDVRRAADDAGVRIVEVLEPSEIDELRATMRAIWGDEVVPPRNVLRGLALGGGCLLVAVAGDEPVGFALGWLGWTAGVHLHSHQVGVVGTHRGTGVGLALKLAQRALALDHGIEEMRWTFDPVLRRNARFNMVRLGCQVVAFHPHCYGDRVDAFNTADVTDRVEVSWRLDRPVGGGEVVPLDGDEVVPIPADYHALRDDDPDAATKARTSIGAALAAAFADGRTVRGVGGDGWVICG